MIKKIISLSLFLSAAIASAQFTQDAPWMESFNEGTRASAPTFQEIVTAFEAYWADKDPSVKGSGYKPFKRWESLYQDYLNPDGTVMTASQTLEAWNQKNAMRNAQADDSDWQSVGPLNHINSASWSAGQGRVNAMAVDPVTSSTMYIGAPAGGIWKSTDSGTTWIPLIDEFPQIGVSAIAIDPNNTDIIYIGTGDDDAGDSTGIGILKSVDGGDSWDFTGLNESNSPTSFNEIFIHPTNSDILWTSSSSGFYKSTDAGVNWTRTLTTNVKDLRVHTQDPDILYAVSSSIFFKSSDGGDSWQTTTNGTPSGSARLAIDVTPANEDVVYILAANGDFGFLGVYKSTDNGESFSYQSGGVGDIFESTQAWYDMAFAVSDTNEDELFTGVLNVWKSTTGGNSFSKVNNWNQPSAAAYTHADIHNLRFIDGKLYCGSDGGIYVSEDGGTNFTDLTEGLAIGQFYRISVTPQNSQLIAGGLQDNGGYARTNDQWYNYYGADGMENVFHPENPNVVFGFTQGGGGLYTSTDGGLTRNGGTGAPQNGNWITPLAFTSDGRLFAGYSAVYEYNLCTSSWAQTSTNFGTRVDRIATDPNDPDVMYVVTNRTLRRSENGGSTFTTINTFTTDITWVDVNQVDSDIIYVSTAGTGGRVFRGDVDGNTATFTDITGSLPNIPKLVVKHQGLHSDNPLFLGTSIGVWRYDDVTNDWEPFENNLPNVAVRDLEINLRDGNITAGTYGRGVWQSAIPLDVPPTDISVSAVEVGDGSYACGDIIPIVTIQNKGASTVSTVDIEYTIDGNTETFQWTGTLESQNSIEVELPAVAVSSGQYDLLVTAITDSDSFSQNNDLTISFVANQEGEFNEENTFESAADELIVAQDGSGYDPCNSGTPDTLWERGIPSGALLNQAASGTNVYGTNLNANHPDNTKEYLVTQCYDLSQYTNPSISFQMAFDLELDWDIVYVEYTTDAGNTWEVLGTADDPNWYNSDTVPGSNCQNCPGAQWTGTNADLTEYSYDLSAFTNEASMIFRFVFHSDAAVNQEGAIIDDLLVSGEALSIEEETIANFQLYPNPSQGIFNLDWTNVSKAELAVYDITGKEIVRVNAIEQGANGYVLDMTRFATGMYILQATLDGRQLTKKLLVQ